MPSRPIRAPLPRQGRRLVPGPAVGRPKRPRGPMSRVGRWDRRSPFAARSHPSPATAAPGGRPGAGRHGLRSAGSGRRPRTRSRSGRRPPARRRSRLIVRAPGAEGSALDREAVRSGRQAESCRARDLAVGVAIDPAGGNQLIQQVIQRGGRNAGEGCERVRRHGLLVGQQQGEGGLANTAVELRRGQDGSSIVPGHRTASERAATGSSSSCAS